MAPSRKVATRRAIRDYDGPKRYAVYVRVSSEAQVKDGDSIDTQKALALEIIERNMGELFRIYEDPGISASSTDLEDRPGLMQLLADASAGLFDAVIVFRRDRLARKTEHAAFLRAEFKRCGVEVVYSAPGEMAGGDDPSGRLMETLLDGMAQFETDVLSQRIIAVKRHKAKEGEWIGGAPPFGYVKNGEIMSQVPEEIKVVKEIEDMYLGGIGEYTIMRWLNGDVVRGLGQRPGGAIYRRHMTRAGLHPWTTDSVGNVLTSKFYHGKWEWNKTAEDPDERIIVDGTHQACRTEERYNELQAIRQQRLSRAKSPRFYATQYLLTGLLHCKDCGAKWNSRNRTAPKTGKEYGYYLCGSKNNNKTWVGCPSRMVQKEMLEQFVVERVMHHAQTLNFEALVVELENERTQQNEGAVEALRQVEEQVTLLTKRKRTNMNLLEDAYEDGDTQLVKELKDRQGEIKVALENALRRRAELESVVSNASVEYAGARRLFERLRAFPSEYEKAPQHLKKAFLDDVVERIEIAADGTVDITFRINPSTAPHHTHSDCFITDSTLGRSLKKTTGKLTLGYTLTDDFDAWWRRKFDKVSELFPTFVRSIAASCAYNGRVGPNGLSRATGLGVRVCQNYLYYGVIPSRKNAEILCGAFGQTLDDMVVFFGVGVSADVMFQILEYRDTWHRHQHQEAVSLHN